MKTIFVVTILLVLTLSQWAYAEDTAEEPLQLYLSWSASTQQDTLFVGESMWTHCYLWVSSDITREGFVGYWGTLYHTNAIAAHVWRYLGAGAGDDFSLNPSNAMQPIAYLDAECENLITPQALFEFDVYVDVAQMIESGARESELSLRPDGLSDWDPKVFFRVNREDPCGNFSHGEVAGTNVITAVAAPTAISQFSFGRIKAMYR